MANRQRGTGGDQQQRTQGQRTQGQGKQQERAMQQGQSSFDSTYWQQQYRSEPYYNQARNFGDYEPAYRLGTESRSRYAGQRFEDVEGDLRGEYEASRGSSHLGWDEAREATRAAWDRQDRMDTSGRDRQGHDR